MSRFTPQLAVALRRLGGRRADRVATWLDRRSLNWRNDGNPLGDEAVELRNIVQFQASRRVKVREPLVLVSQVHRSGGTLLQRLLDGHPELHVLPHELGPLVPDRPVPLEREAAWDLLYDPKLPGRFRRGLRQQERELNSDESQAGFLLPPLVHRSLYERIMKRGPGRSERVMLNGYLTAYFNGWLDYRGLRDPGKRWVVGFEPLLVDQPKRLESFWRIYPEGRLVAIVRDPASWYVSARRWAARFEQLDVALAIWRGSTVAVECQLDDERVLAVLFEDLVTHPEWTMRAVSSFLGISFTPDLLVPTVNGVPFGANSSFASEGAGTVNAASADRRDALADEERAVIEREVGELYERVRNRVVARLGRPS